MEKVEIRKEIKEDSEAVFNLIKSAFENAEHTDNDEHNLVDRLRKSEAFVSELSLVAEFEGKIVGHILFTKVKVNKTIQLALAPVAVLPKYQGKGIGEKLILKGHSIAKKLGYEYSILLGHPTYYPKFGYVDAGNFGIKPPFEVPEGTFMAINLCGEKTILNGVVEYAKEFFEK